METYDIIRQKTKVNKTKENKIKIKTDSEKTIFRSNLFFRK